MERGDTAAQDKANAELRALRAGAKPGETREVLQENTAALNRLVSVLEKLPEQVSTAAKQPPAPDGPHGPSTITTANGRTFTLSGTNEVSDSDRLSDGSVTPANVKDLVKAVDDQTHFIRKGSAELIQAQQRNAGVIIDFHEKLRKAHEKTGRQLLNQREVR